MPEPGALAVPHRIPADRYRSRAWHELEHARLWPRVWQIACTADCVPHAGDWHEYRLGPLSILIVRGEDGELRAFQNACRHRGNLLLQGSGSGLRQVRCGYHGWCYGLDGRLRHVPPDGAATARPWSLALTPVGVGVFGGLVFVNPDPGAVPLAEFLGPLTDELAWVRMGEYTCRQAYSVELECNWKVIVDAFIETYHLHVVHPQMLGIADDLNTPIRLLGSHSMFEQPYGVASARLVGSQTPKSMWEAFVRDLGHRIGLGFAAGREPGPHPPIPQGATLRDVLVGRIREHLRSQGDPYPGLPDARLIDDYHYHFFPNAVFNVFAGWYGMIRARPGDRPDRAWLDMWNFDWLPPGHPEQHARPRQRVLAPDEAAALGLVVSQDLALLPQVQRGLEQPGTRVLHLVGAEARIGWMHRVLDRWLGTSLERELAAQETVC